MLRCAVPASMGGLGGGVDELEALMRTLCQQSLSAALLFWSQRLAVEFLVQSPNGAVREYLLPDMLTLERAATTPLSGAHAPLQARDAGRGWRLQGSFATTANAQPEGFTLVAPVQLGVGQAGWAALRSEEDGLQVEHARLFPELLETATARIRVENTWFREDEWLGDASLLLRVSPVAQALGVIYHALLEHVGQI